MSISKIRIENVTPEIAKEYLGNNAENQRKISLVIVKSLTKEIAMNKWLLSNDALVFCNDKLLNGQHRLSAVIESGKPCEFCVLTVDDDKIMHIMDGGKPRNISDVIRIEGLGYSKAIASASTWILGYKRNALTTLNNLMRNTTTSQSRFVSRSEQVDFCLRYGGRLEVACKGITALYDEYGTATPSMMIAVWFLISEKHSEKKANEFAEVLYSGEGYNRGSVKPLRIMLFKNSTTRRKLPRPAVFGLMIKTFNSWIQGTVPGTLKLAINEDFPVLHQ